jgi:hypothetical protein
MATTEERPGRAGPSPESHVKAVRAVRFTYAKRRIEYIASKEPRLDPEQIEALVSILRGGEDANV